MYITSISRKKALRSPIIKKEYIEKISLLLCILTLPFVEAGCQANVSSKERKEHSRFVLPEIPSDLQTMESRLDYMTRHYWDHFDFKDTAYIHLPDITEQAIVDYIDFRSYMQDYYDERKRTSVFSWREFSGAAGFISPSYIKVVCDGKSKLSRIGVERVGQAMGLVGFEMEYFRAMVVYGQEENDEKKKAAFEEMLRIAKVHKVRVLEGDVFNYFESWLNPVMRELAPLMPGATPG
ncbi:MAG: TIGR02147 family protein, partial [Bacteroidales bacterium]|nr:TIGR02147 family protein [Bacteroidales bacterium]